MNMVDFQMFSFHLQTSAYIYLYRFSIKLPHAFGFTTFGNKFTQILNFFEFCAWGIFKYSTTPITQTLMGL